MEGKEGGRDQRRREKRVKKGRKIWIRERRGRETRKKDTEMDKQTPANTK